MRERSKDLRVRRTLTAVRKAFNDLVLARNYNEISITDLTEKADNIGEYARKLDLEGCITYFYKYLESCSKVEKKLMCDEHYAFFYNEVVDTVLKSDEFSKFFSMTKYPSIVRSYTKAITAIYKDWLNDGKETDFSVLTDTATKLLGSGYSGIINR